MVNELFNPRGKFNEANETYEEKPWTLTVRHAMYTEAKRLKQECNLYLLKNRTVSRLCYLHTWRKILKVTALSKKINVNIESHQETSKYINRFADTAAILISIVSNSYYGMLWGQIHIHLPPGHPIMSFETIGPLQKYHNILCLSSKILRKHCFYFLLGPTIVSRGNKNNAYAKF